MFSKLYARDEAFQQQPFSGSGMVSGSYTFPSTTNYATAAVTFQLDADGNPPFSDAPIIMTQMVLSSTRGENGRANVVVIPGSVSANGFTMRLLNGDSSAIAPTVDWIAFGTPFEAEE